MSDLHPPALFALDGNWLDTLSFVNWTLIHIASEWVIRLGMLFYVPQRRSAAAARAWLLLIFFFPWPGVILYSLIGRPYLPKRRLERQQRATRLIRELRERFVRSAHLMRPQLDETLARAVTLAERLGDFGILGNNGVELLTDYGQSIDRLIDDIDSAQRHVHLLYYIFADDATGRRVADALLRAAGRGVPCRVLLDALGAQSALRRVAPGLRKAQIEVHSVLPYRIWNRNRARRDLRNHRKIAVIDGRIGYAGSQNLINADFKHGLVYEELVARLTGPIVGQLQAIWLVDRYLETDDPIADDDLFPELAAAGQSPAQALPSGPGYRRANVQRSLVALVYAAKRRVVITTPYFVPDEPLAQALQTAALRGVEIILIASEAHDQVLVCLAQRSYYEELLEAGVRIHHYRPRFLHAKHVTIDDDVAIVGSSNIDIRSFRLNSEISVLIYDREIVGQLARIQDGYLAQSRELSYDEWVRRPLLSKVAQNTARLVDSVL
ncbi:MAG TPA: cardiolipin synthase [Pirellulales bacterium]|nr:cardiolipin synthase [Pirellulales bacterium]